MSGPLPASSEGHPELAVAWVMHALEPDEAAVFAAHLDGCLLYTSDAADE